MTILQIDNLTKHTVILWMPFLTIIYWPPVMDITWYRVRTGPLRFNPLPLHLRSHITPSRDWNNFCHLMLKKKPFLTTNVRQKHTDTTLRVLWFEVPYPLTVERRVISLSAWVATHEGRVQRTWPVWAGGPWVKILLKYLDKKGYYPMVMTNYYNVFDERAAYDDKNTISDNCNTFKVLIKLIIDWDGIGYL